MLNKIKEIIIPPANFVCGGVYCFHVVRACVRASVCASVRPFVCGGVYCFHVVRACVRASVCASVRPSVRNVLFP